VHYLWNYPRIFCRHDECIHQWAGILSVAFRCGRKAEQIASKRLFLCTKLHGVTLRRLYYSIECLHIRFLVCILVGWYTIVVRTMQCRATSNVGTDTQFAKQNRWRKKIQNWPWSPSGERKDWNCFFVALHIIRRVRRRGDGWTHYPCC